MQTDWREQRRLRELADLATRKKRDADNTDPELESCVIAYHAHRVDGGQMRFEEFRRDWYRNKGNANGSRAS